MYQREELKGAAPGETHHFTSIALCGRHFKGTSSLKTRALDFHVRQYLFAPPSSFYVVQRLTLSR